jgi:Family of unknown function (DUF5329)
MPRRLLASLLLALACVGVTATPTPAAHAEIEHLLTYLRDSGCRFHRNGAWHEAPAAAQHLRDKFEVMRQRGMIGSAESFIDRGASSSSMSGKPYLVRCGEAAPQPSGPWLHAELKRHRAAAAK